MEAIARPDAHIWHSAMDHERKSLADMKAFEEVDLPKGERAIGLKWVFDIKTDAAGARIHGKEKAHLVAQGFNQHPVESSLVAGSGQELSLLPPAQLVT